MAIATSDSVAQAGYDFDFVDPLPDRLICKICYLPSYDPYLSVCCGHLFCKSCQENVRNSPAISKACPICRDEEFVTFPNKAIDREIKSLHMYCTNKVTGCHWQGELNDINNHLGNSDVCQFVEVECANYCRKMIQRRYLISHIENECPRRKVNCEYCHDTGEHQHADHHKKKCPKLPLPCPNKCKFGSVPREDMEEHRKECPLEMIKCEYSTVGCEARMARKDQEKHKKEKMEEHLMKTRSQLTNALQRISILEAFMYQTTNQVTNTISITAAVMQSRSLGWSEKLATTAMLSESGDQVCPVVLKVANFAEIMKNKTDWCNNSFYVHYKGYKMCLQLKVNTAEVGYNISKGGHLSCYLFLMKGPHDDYLTWPLRGKFMIRLLNQIKDSDHNIWIVNYNEVEIPDRCDFRVIEDCKAEKGFGTDRFICNEDLFCNSVTFCQYLKDDCLFFQIIKL